MGDTVPRRISFLSRCLPAHLLLLLVGVGLLLPVFRVAAETARNELRNPGFEDETDGTLAGWKPYGRGYVVDRNIVHGGQGAIRCEARNDRDGMGVAQVIRYEKPDRRPIVIAGWSRAEKVGGRGDYSIYLDIFYADGTPWWGKTCSWTRGDHDWRYEARVFYPRKPVREIKVFVFLRRTTGRVWFDDLELCRGGFHLIDCRSSWDFPRTPNGLDIEAGFTEPARWRCAFFDRGGGRLAVDAGNGKRLRVREDFAAGARPVKARITATNGRDETLTHDLPLPPHPKKTNPVRSGYAIWGRDSMRKIGPAEYPDAMPPTRRAEISLARNEHEGIQFGVTTADTVNLRRVRVDVGSFRDDRGREFPPANLQLYRVGYVWVATPSGHPLAPATSTWQPEVLLPCTPFQVRGGVTQGVWLDAYAPPEVPPGRYRGTVTFSPENAPAAVFRLTLRVWRFTLPTRPAMKTAFCIMDGFTREIYGPISPALRRRCLDIMLDHRLNPDDISRTEPPAFTDLDYARKRGLNAFNILNLVPRPKGHPLWVCYAPRDTYGPAFLAELRQRLDPYVAGLRQRGLTRYAYVYGFDERRKDYDAVIRDVFGFIKKRYPEVHTFTTAGYLYERRKKNPDGPEDFVDWYCPLTSRYDDKTSAALRRRGRQVWWYVCCSPRHPYANFASIDYPAIEGRLLGWMTWGARADGLLYWHVNYWHGNRILKPAAGPYLDWKSPCVARMTGDGCLIYPLSDGPAPSIRLENIRDGIEDYDYLTLLSRVAGREAAVELLLRLVTDRTHFQREPTLLRRVRAEAAAAIEARLDAAGQSSKPAP